MKLLANKVRSECLVSWDPFMQRSGGDVCGAFFGSAACMKKEITETCGEADWRMVRKVGFIEKLLEKYKKFVSVRRSSHAGDQKLRILQASVNV